MRTVAILAALAACSSSSSTGVGSTLQPAELVGAWTASGALGDPDQPGPSWTKTYKLAKDGTFEMSGYPPIQVTGKWKVTERDGNRFRLVLTDQQMRASPGDKPSAWSDEDSWVVLDGEALAWKDQRYHKGE